MAELDIEERQIAAIRSLIERDKTNVVMDLRNLLYIDSAGIQELATPWN